MSFFKYIINLWCSFNLILIISYFFIEHDVNILFWMNSSVYFFLSLLSLFIAIRDRYTKDVFINLTIMFFLYSISIAFKLFSAKGATATGAVTNNLPLYGNIMLKFVMMYSIFYLVLKYIFKNKEKWSLYFITLVLTTATISLCFSKYVLESSLFIQNTDPINIGALISNAIAIISIILYAGTLYRFDRPNGHYIHVLLIGFFMHQVFGLVDIIFKIYGNMVDVVNESILLMNLLFLILVLSKKLRYTYSPFGEFYEGLIFSKHKVLNLKIKRKGHKNIQYFIEMCDNLYRNRSLYTSIVFISCILLLVAPLSVFFKINIFVFSLCVLIILTFSIFLFQKRIRNHNVISE